MYARLGLPGRAPQFVVEFYPYTTLKQTLRFHGEQARVRLAEALDGAPLAVLEAAAQLLLARAYRLPVPPAAARLFRDYALRASTRRRLARVRRRRAAPARCHGQAFSLQQLFDRLNQRYFAGRLRPPELCWSTRPWRQQLGVCDPVLGRITLNCRLDDPGVPRFVVEYVLYHEMLHLVQTHRAGLWACRFHSPHFRRAEQRFAFYRAARRWLAQWH